MASSRALDSRAWAIFPDASPAALAILRDLLSSPNPSGLIAIETIAENSTCLIFRQSVLPHQHSRAKVSLTPCTSIMCVSSATVFPSKALHS